MDTFTVYLFVRDRSRTQSASSLDQRLAAQQALREELVSMGVRVTALPYEADLQVEVTNVLGTYERSDDGMPRGDHHRVLIIRLLIGDEPVEFVCSDGIGNVPAERHAARRVLVWLNNLAEYQSHAGRLAGMTLNLSTN